MSEFEQMDNGALMELIDDRLELVSEVIAFFDSRSAWLHDAREMIQILYNRQSFQAVQGRRD